MKATKEFMEEELAQTMEKKKPIKNQAGLAISLTTPTPAQMAS
jgi:hypothetical protein